ncbi:hypothetical protein [Phreatobacter oligotrophus]|uniref:hypothetical protein n=1 Tax=Phreatobacter oligotrophus TaxID=1122261 RepID=UPI0023547F24|nr:hypothetical protein [Phreatobacter oligotrophus]MBX9991096.1 hypothetical protein [Phreatobacter oligotrophus]
MRITTRLLATLVLVGAGATASLAQGANEIGLPSCDRFITDYEACITTKVPEAQRGAFSQQITQLRGTWRELARDGQARQQLDSVCTAQSAQLRQVMAPYGCSF